MLIELENEWLKVGISESGAELRSVKHRKNEIDYMWTADDAYWGRVSPVLFPIVGRLKNDTYTVDSKEYSMSQHGFLRDVEFDLDEQTDVRASFMFESAGRFTEIYPYEFKALIHYELDEDALSVKWEIINLNNEVMYFSIGAHPAFSIPLVQNEIISDYRLEFTPSANKNVTEYEVKDALIYKKGKVNELSSIALSDSLFINDALIFDHIDSVKLVSNKSPHSVEVKCKDFPFVGVWSKYVEKESTMAPFVCIEPWYGLADTDETDGNFKNKKAINKLEISETFEAIYKMIFK